MRTHTDLCVVKQCYAHPYGFMRSETKLCAIALSFPHQNILLISCSTNHGVSTKALLSCNRSVTLCASFPNGPIFKTGACSCCIAENGILYTSPHVGIF